MTAPLLEVRSVERIYPGRRDALGRRAAPLRALDDVSLTVTAGENVALVGESGSGKSTLARLIMALDRPSSGEVLHDGTPLSSAGPGELKAMRRRFQMIFQDPFASLDPRQTVARSVADPLLAQRIERPGPALDKRVAQALAAVGLPADAAGRFPHEFSGGQRQRIAVARAIIMRPDLVVADEPVSALDVSIQAQILNLLLDLHDQLGMTYLFISHDLAVVRHIAPRVVVLYAGQVMETGVTAETFDEPAHPYTRALVDAVPRPDDKPRAMHAETAAVSPADAGASTGCPYVARCPLAIDRCRAVRPPLVRRDDGRQVACHLAELS